VTRTVGPDDSLPRELLAAVAACADVDPLDFDRSLFDVVDLDALERVVDGGDPATRFRFVYYGFTVVVETGTETRIDVYPDADSAAHSGADHQPC
jgi:hypothetical protein